jgi:uncharacterized protein YdaU (DUF1376 family)
MPISASFPFFPSDYQGDPHTIVMTTEENGAYCLLMWVCWELEGLPNDLDELAGYARLPVKKFQPMWEKRIKRCFIFDEKRDKFLHPRFEKIIREIKAFRKQKSKAGKVSGQKRRERKKLDSEQVLDSVPVSFEQTTNENEPSFSSSSSTSNSKEREEEEEEEEGEEGPPISIEDVSADLAIQEVEKAFSIRLDLATQKLVAGAVPPILAYKWPEFIKGRAVGWTKSTDLEKLRRIAYALTDFQKDNQRELSNGNNSNGYKSERDKQGDRVRQQRAEEDELFRIGLERREAEARRALSGDSQADDSTHDRLSESAST